MHDPNKFLCWYKVKLATVLVNDQQFNKNIYSILKLKNDAFVT